QGKRGQPLRFALRALPNLSGRSPFAPRTIPRAVSPIPAEPGIFADKREAPSPHSSWKNTASGTRRKWGGLCGGYPMVAARTQREPRLGVCQILIQLLRKNLGHGECGWACQESF